MNSSATIIANSAPHLKNRALTLSHGWLANQKRTQYILDLISLALGTNSTLITPNYCMKSKILLLSVVTIGGLLTPVTSLFAQGTAFTYQGRLNDNGQPANGSYDLTFALFGDSNGGSQVGNTVTNAGTGVSSGLFTATLDFGPGVFTGTNLWLEVAVRANGSAGGYTTLSPRQPVLPTPYAIMASTANSLSGTLPATNLSGVVGNDQLANSSLTVNAGTGLAGGGTVALGGSTTLSNAGLLSIDGEFHAVLP